jgi:chromosome segregation ATPase
MGTYVSLFGFFGFFHTLSRYLFFLYRPCFVQNLLKAVETSNEGARDAAQAKLVEAKMRADLLHCTSEKNDALSRLEEVQRRVELLEDDVRNLKDKSTKLQSDKVQLERDYRSAQAMIDSLHGSLNMDVEYYKRKVRQKKKKKTTTIDTKCRFIQSFQSQKSNAL